MCLVVACNSAYRVVAAYSLVFVRQHPHHSRCGPPIAAAAHELQQLHASSRAGVHAKLLQRIPPVWTLRSVCTEPGALSFFLPCGSAEVNEMHALSFVLW